MAVINGFNLEKLISQFQIVAEFVEGHAWTKGHINDTYIVPCRQGGTPIRYMLQRINHDVFPYPELVMQNVKQITEHLRKKISAEASRDLTRRTMTLVPARGGAPPRRCPPPTAPYGHTQGGRTIAPSAPSETSLVLILRGRIRLLMRLSLIHI